jgi:hypothetical protein
MMACRYAVYLAPPPKSPLWRFGSEVLGYDAASGMDIHGFAPPGYASAEWRAATERPRRYGFHGTLKAPFRLAEGATERSLIAALREEAARHVAFDAGPLVVTSLKMNRSSFVALVLHKRCETLDALETSIVERLDPFRAPATEGEIEARQPERLTARQRATLLRWGYPYAGPDFSFHMTLSGPLQQPEPVAEALALACAERMHVPQLAVDSLTLFVQPAPDAPFRIIEWVPLIAR